MKNLITKLLYAALFSLVLVTGCKKDEMEDEDVIASFQYAVSAEDWTEVTFSNFSQNATSYAWNFGDGNSSTAENPTHSYAEEGSYEVTLTATGASGSASKTETVMVVDPSNAAAFLTGETGRVWHLNRQEIALGIGPVAGDNSWWSLGGVTPIGDRPCIVDDAYTFNPDGTFEKNTNGTLFADADANGGWLGIEEQCLDETSPGVFVGPNGEDISAYADGGSYTYDFDTSNNTITINGEGAYIGLLNKTDNGDTAIPIPFKTYQILSMGTGPIADSLNIAIVAIDNSYAWNFHLLHYHNPADLPDIPSSLPGANFSVMTSGNTATFTNTSTNSVSYLWDFGDGNMSVEENPEHTYAADGDYTVTLTATDENAQTDQTSQTVSISSAVFTADALSNATGKVWRLDGESSYFVGPCAGCSDWWPGIDAAGVIERACQLDDEFIFFDDGTFEIATQGDVWVEDYLGFTPSCVDESMLASPFDVFGSGTHTFSSTDTEITVDGTGAYIGFNRPFNGGELPGDASGTPASSITYTVFGYSNNAGVERLTVTIDYGENPGEAFWTMRLIAQ